MLHPCAMHRFRGDNVIGLATIVRTLRPTCRHGLFNGKWNAEARGTLVRSSSSRGAWPRTCIRSTKYYKWCGLGRIRCKKGLQRKQLSNRCLGMIFVGEVMQSIDDLRNRVLTSPAANVRSLHGRQICALSGVLALHQLHSGLFGFAE